ncbi:MAG: LuxR family transcriptional regulator, partial [Blastocatellia bacterium]|nr:LuxR family transcriptional regulator [Blastocatellia bacterium]
MEPREWHLLETLAPHLQRAAAVHALLARTRATANSLSAAAGFAVFVLTGDSRVLFANSKAEDLVRRQTGLRYERGQLAAMTPALTHRLHALARAGSRPGGAEGDIGGTLELCRGETCPPLLAHVIPLAANRAAAVFDIDRPAAAVFVVDPAAGLGVQIQRFAARFG